jgi:clorobiocin biosynthesis protein CloN1
VSTGSAEVEHVLARIWSILAEVWDEHPVEVPVDSEASLLSLGIDSLMLVTLLDRIQREFAFDWDPDDPPGAHSSLHSIAHRAVPSGTDIRRPAIGVNGSCSPGANHSHSEEDHR